MSRRTEGTIPSPEGTAAVLTVSRLSADLVQLREILAEGNWRLHEASDCCEALASLRDESVPVLLCECDHADDNRQDVLRATARRPDPPNLIVFSRLADEYLWARVLNLGGFIVLMTPSEPEEVLRVTPAAWTGGNMTSLIAPRKRWRLRAAGRRPHFGLLEPDMAMTKIGIASTGRCSFGPGEALFESRAEMR